MWKLITLNDQCWYLFMIEMISYWYDAGVELTMNFPLG